jgi:FG-GAP repeat
MRRAVGILLLTGLLSLLVWPLPALAGHAGSAGTAASSRGVRADFNGDGTADLAIGAPGEDTARGVVQVLYGSANRLTATGSQLWTQDSSGIVGVAEPGDFFGGALAAGDFNGDGRADLAVGAEGEDNAAGAVQVLYGSPTGLAATGNQLWSQDSSGIVGVAEPGDRFGFALAAGDFNGDGAADLAIGAPGEDDLAGLVNVLYGSANRLAATGNQFWTQNSPGIAGVAEFGDILGFALAAGPLSTAGGDTANPAATSPAQRNRLARSTPG